MSGACRAFAKSVSRSHLTSRTLAASAVNESSNGTLTYAMYYSYARVHGPAGDAVSLLPPGRRRSVFVLLADSARSRMWDDAPK